MNDREEKYALSSCEKAERTENVEITTQTESTRGLLWCLVDSPLKFKFPQIFGITTRFDMQHKEIEIRETVFPIMYSLDNVNWRKINLLYDSHVSNAILICVTV